MRERSSLLCPAVEDEKNKFGETDARLKKDLEEKAKKEKEMSKKRPSKGSASGSQAKRRKRIQVNERKIFATLIFSSVHPDK